MSEFIGIKEKWVERGWTRKQMRDRIEELGLTVNSWCVLQPYELNFMQNPEANQEILEEVEERVVASGNLWKPGETITVSCEKTKLADNFESTVKKFVMQDVQPHVSMKFKFVDSGGMVTVKMVSGAVGGSTIGKLPGESKRQQQVTISGDFFKKGLVDKFNWTRYVIVHEFGHTLGLYHEFDRKQCNQAGITCADEDPSSVMNYPVGTKGGVKDTMDHFSPGDVTWLKKVYA